MPISSLGRWGQCSQRGQGLTGALAKGKHSGDQLISRPREEAGRRGVGGAKIGGRVGPAQTSGANKPERPLPSLSAYPSQHHRWRDRFLPHALLIPPACLCLSQCPHPPVRDAFISPTPNTSTHPQSVCPDSSGPQALQPRPPSAMTVSPSPLMLLGLHSDGPKVRAGPP